jgi:hypothetical protein
MDVKKNLQVLEATKCRWRGKSRIACRESKVESQKSKARIDFVKQRKRCGLTIDRVCLPIGEEASI